MGAVDLQLQRLRDHLGTDMTAEAAGVVGMVGEVEAIEELAIEPPSLDVQLVESRRGSHAAFTVTSGTWFKLRLLALLKKLPPGPVRLTSRFGFNTPCGPTAGEPTVGVLPPKKEVCGFSTEAATLNSGPMSCQTRIPGCRAARKSRDRFEIDHAGRIDAGRIDAGFARGIERLCLAGEDMKAEIGAIEGDAELAHPRIERIGRNRICGLRRAFEIDFAVTRNARIHRIAFGQDREPGLARRETRFRRVEILALAETE